MKLAIEGGNPVISNHATLIQKWPKVTDDDKEAILQVLDDGEFSGRTSKIVRGFEKDFAKYIDTKYAVAFNTGTSALHACTNALEIGPCDEVIVPAFTFLASAVSILHNQAIPVFCDIDEFTFNIDPNSAAENITNRTKGIMAVHMQGLPADVKRINQIAKSYKVKVIEDCAQSFGAKVDGKFCGNWGDISGFSLMAAKQLASCGELGVVCTNDIDYRNRVDMVKMYGEVIDADGGRSYNSFTLGYNYVANPVQVRFAHNKLQTFNQSIETIISNAQYLSDFIKNEMPFLDPPFIPDGYEHVYHFYRVKVRGDKVGYPHNHFLRAAIMEIMEQEGLKLRLYQNTPVCGQTIFQRMDGYGKGIPWAYNKKLMPFYKDNYNINRYPKTLKVINETFVVGGEGSAPLYFSNRKVIDLYIEGFRKLRDNWPVVIKYAQKIGETYRNPWDQISKISDTKGIFV